MASPSVWEDRGPSLLLLCERMAASGTPAVSMRFGVGRGRMPEVTCGEALGLYAMADSGGTESWSERNETAAAWSSWERFGSISGSVASSLLERLWDIARETVAASSEAMSACVSEGEGGKAS